MRVVSSAKLKFTVARFLILHFSFSRFFFSFSEKITKLVGRFGWHRDYAASNLSNFLCFSWQQRLKDIQLHSTRRQHRPIQVYGVQKQQKGEKLMRIELNFITINIERWLYWNLQWKLNYFRWVNSRHQAMQMKKELNGSEKLRAKKIFLFCLHRSMFLQLYNLLTN